MPPAKKSIVVTGDGPYLGVLITEGFQNVKNATWYDRTKKTNAAIEVERKLVEAGYVKPAKLEAKGAKSGGDVKDCDILVVVAKDKVTVGPPKGKAVTVRFKEVKSMSDLDAIGKAFVNAVKKFMKS